MKLNNLPQQYVSIDLKGKKDCQRNIDKNKIFKGSSEGYDFKFELENKLQNWGNTVITLMVSKDGKPFNSLQPIMGTFSHLVGFYDDYQSLAHIHPMGTELKDKSETGGPVLKFHIQPEKKGYLKLFLQVQIDEKQIFVPFNIMTHHD